MAALSKPRVAIVDDHTLLAAAFARLLDQSCDVIGTYDDSASFIADAATLAPDIVLLDITMPGLNGFDAARELRRIAPKTRIIFLTMHEDADVAAEAFRVGGSGYLLKRSAASELARSIEEVAAGGYYVTPRLTADVLGLLASESAAPRPARALTPRQRQVLQLLATGRSMKEAAAILSVSARTIAFHKYRIMEQLQATSTAALIQIAVREGLV